MLPLPLLECAKGSGPLVCSGTSGINELVDSAKEPGRDTFLANGVLAAIVSGEVGGNELAIIMGEGSGEGPIGEGGGVKLELELE